MAMATVVLTPARTRLRTPVRRRSWKHVRFADGFGGRYPSRTEVSNAFSAAAENPYAPRPFALAYNSHPGEHLNQFGNEREDLLHTISIQSPGPLMHNEV
jgi:hypothetical protein